MTYYCSKCKKEISAAEFNYSIKKYDQALCREDQQNLNKFKTSKNQIKENHEIKNGSSDSNKGLSSKDSRFVENMIKGRIAETLIEELFLQLDYSVFRYGMENTVPGVIKLLRGVRSDVAMNIRRMPDFVVQNSKTNEVHFVEVKFRKSGTFKFSDLNEGYPYENCYFVVVSKKHIKCITYEELKEGKEITPTSRNYLGNRKEFELDKDVIIKFCDFAVKFFEVV